MLALASFVAGFQNALAGGGSFLTLPALLWCGLDSRAANVTSTIALFPAQIATGLAGRRHAGGAASLSLRTLTAISLVGGGLGAVVLLETPTTVFNALLPWLVLFTTMVFAWGTFRGRAPRAISTMRPPLAGAMQFAISLYGGYFGGGIGILMLTVLTLSGYTLRNAAATKNVLAAVINSSAVVIFAFSSDVAWKQAAIVAAAAVGGGQLGAYALTRVNERVMRLGIVGLGVALTIGLFVKYR